MEEIPGVLEGSLQGARDDLVEVVIDPVKLSSYGLAASTSCCRAIGASNSLVAAGALEGKRGQVCGQGALR
jgi:multidrug efflux pump